MRVSRRAKQTGQGSTLNLRHRTCNGAIKRLFWGTARIFIAACGRAAECQIANTTASQRVQADRPQAKLPSARRLQLRLLVQRLCRLDEQSTRSLSTCILLPRLVACDRRVPWMCKNSIMTPATPSRLCVEPILPPVACLERGDLGTVPTLGESCPSCRSTRIRRERTRVSDELF